MKVGGGICAGRSLALAKGVADASGLQTHPGQEHRQVRGDQVGQQANEGAHGARVKSKSKGGWAKGLTVAFLPRLSLSVIVHPLV